MKPKSLIFVFFLISILAIGMVEASILDVVVETVKSVFGAGDEATEDPVLTQDNIIVLNSVKNRVKLGYETYQHNYTANRDVCLDIDEKDCKNRWDWENSTCCHIEYYPDSYERQRSVYRYDYDGKYYDVGVHKVDGKEILTLKQGVISLEN